MKRTHTALCCVSPDGFVCPDHNEVDSFFESGRSLSSKVWRCDAKRRVRLRLLHIHGLIFVIHTGVPKAGDIDNVITHEIDQFV